MNYLLSFKGVMEIVYIKGNAMLQLINTFTILLNILSLLLMK